MDSMRRVAVVNDLSGFGRCSLTVALPILASMGLQPCPAPTVILSAHTGYENPYIHSFTEELAPYLHHWESMDLTFDGVYTGFLGDERQAKWLVPLLRRTAAQGGLRLVDPAMADHGRLYATCAPALVDAMAKLVALASVTTPNLTEACLLTGEEYTTLMEMPVEERRGVIESMGRRLLETGCGAVVITGVPEEESLSNLVLDGVEAVWVSTPRIQRSFAGTGDVFSSVLCGKLLQGVPLLQAVEQTAAFVGKVTAYTAKLNTPEQDGIAFEPFLREICEE
ncbi:MAG: pyridoxamine kinase [Clostridia bacterium]|nr:pyridoxamine kinase [Clostridia bacterium]